MTEKMTYREQLMHPNWQKLRLEKLNAAEWSCQLCGDADTTLHVHHKRYIKGRLAWEYPDENFEVLCDPCHQSAHAAMDELTAILADAEGGSQGLPTIIALVRGYLDATCSLGLRLPEIDIDYSIAGRAYMAGLIAACTENLPHSTLRPRVERMVGDGVQTPTVDYLLHTLRKPSSPNSL